MGEIRVDRMTYHFDSQKIAEGRPCERSAGEESRQMLPILFKSYCHEFYESMNYLYSEIKKLEIK